MEVLVSDAIVEVLRREGTELIFGYPRNAVLEAAARADIRTIIVRQERTGLHMADAYSRMSRGARVGVFCMQHGPGAENAYGAVAQAYSESVPVLVLPQGYPRRIAHVPDNYNATIAMAQIAKHCEPLTAPGEVGAVFSRAYSALRNGRHRPVVIELPHDVLAEEHDAPLSYRPIPPTRYAPDTAAVSRAAEALAKAERPVLYAGQGVHWANAYDELRELAELLAIPVCTSLEGKSAFDETHPLALGSGGLAAPATVRHFLERSDLIVGIGCSLSETAFGIRMPAGKRIVHQTLDPADLHKSIPADFPLVGDAKLSLAMLIEACRSLGGRRPDRAAVEAEIKAVEGEWMRRWRAKLTSDTVPLTPYRVLWDLQHSVDVENVVITHDAGSPRDQLSPFWKSKAPLSYIGWGKSTQLGYGLGLAMGAKLACPDRLCINVWGDAAIGMTGMDLETAARERIPILSILLNNSSMAMELSIMPEATRRFRSPDISGDYAAFARALGCHGERVAAFPSRRSTSLRPEAPRAEAGRSPRFRAESGPARPRCARVGTRGFADGRPEWRPPPSLPRPG